MKIPKLTRAHGLLFFLLSFSALLIFAELRTAATVLKLKQKIADANARTEYATSRAGELTELLGRMSEELDRAKSAPVRPAQNAPALLAVIENCATAAGINAAVSLGDEKDGKVTLDVTCRAGAGELLTFMRELLAKGETFFIERTESRSLSDGLDVGLRLSAFVRAEAR